MHQRQTVNFAHIGEDDARNRFFVAALRYIGGRNLKPISYMLERL